MTANRIAYVRYCSPTVILIYDSGIICGASNSHVLPDTTLCLCLRSSSPPAPRGHLSGDIARLCCLANGGNFSTYELSPHSSRAQRNMSGESAVFEACPVTASITKDSIDCKLYAPFRPYPAALVQHCAGTGTLIPKPSVARNADGTLAFLTDNLVCFSTEATEEQHSNADKTQNW